MGSWLSSVLLPQSTGTLHPRSRPQFGQFPCETAYRSQATNLTDRWHSKKGAYEISFHVTFETSYHYRFRSKHVEFGPTKMRCIKGCLIHWHLDITSSIVVDSMSFSQGFPVFCLHRDVPVGMWWRCCAVGSDPDLQVRVVSEWKYTIAPRRSVGIDRLGFMGPEFLKHTLEWVCLSLIFF